ncbi:unnamed protein product, partial [Prorocentrum cordatum]
ENPLDDRVALHNGFSRTPYQLIGDMLFRPSQSIMYDWSHTYLQDGICDAEFGTFMSSCRTVASYAELGELVRAIAPPRAFPRLGSLLGPNKIRNALKNDEFQSDCGEFCTLAQIASRYLRE